MFFSNEIIGLDIGSSSIKAASLKRRKKGFELTGFVNRPIPHDLIIEGAIEKPELVTEALTNLFKSEKIKCKNIVNSLSGQSLVIKKINLPKMSEKELDEAIRTEAEQYIPFDIDDVNFDFQVIKEKIAGESEGGETSDGNKLDVLLVAVQKERIEEKNTPVIAAGLIPAIVDLDVFALENVVEHNYGQPDVDVLALINMGASFVNVNILINGITEVTRDILGGGYQITHALQKQFQLEFEQAEKMKLGIDLYGNSEKDIAEAIYSELKEISHEINKMFHDFTTSTQFNIDRAMLSGGCAKILNIDRILTDNFDIPTEIINPFANIKINEKKFDPEYIKDIAPQAAVCVGLALRQMNDRKR